MNINIININIYIHLIFLCQIKYKHQCVHFLLKKN